MTICVCINTHKAYLKYLMAAMAAVDSQTRQPAQKIIAYDGPGEDVVSFMRDGWEFICEAHGRPNPLRNGALDMCTEDWIIYADGDDRMHQNYVNQCHRSVRRAADAVGVVYSDVQYVDQGARLNCPEWERNGYWRLRQKNYISSTSCWRVAAIKDAGGWSEHTKCYDDYSLALEVTRRKWVGLKGQGLIQVSDHRDEVHRRKTGAQDSLKVFGHAWHHRTYCMLTLMAGRNRMLGPWQKWICDAYQADALPPNFHVIAVDDSKDREFREQLERICHDLPVRAEVHDVPESVQIQREPTVFKRDRGPAHRHVARMYDHYFLREIQDDFIFTVEDDNLGPIDGLKRLAEKWDYHLRAAAIGAVYLSRHNRDNPVGPNSTIVASNHRKYWACDVQLKHVKGKGLVQFQQIAGGFTLWNMGVLKSVGKIEYGYLNGNGRPYGWDSDLSLKCGKLGFKLYLAGDVFAEHRYNEVD